MPCKVTISTPLPDADQGLGNPKQFQIADTIHDITPYGLPSDGSSKGLILGVPLRFVKAEIFANLDQRHGKMFAYHTLGQFKLVVPPFAGPKVMYFVTLHYSARSTPARCTKTVPV
ncbi:hypothetical protein HPB48_007096 [Haemaphysalis longicornis]|uniref:Uncharacterized protein n=1 Tax=Haemaphysalis longicornis TaxID=44386 RepID=A0A9J6FMX1_HAELO|nr:hypothetical protein HPB48_007096 [Haemaphysalis longicornis]